MNKQTVLKVSVRLNADMTVKESKCEIANVLKTNEKRMVLDDESFTVLNLKKEKYTAHGNLDHVVVREETSMTMIDIFGKFSISVYSTASVKVTENRVNKAFNKWLSDKLAVYGQASKVNIKLEVK